MTFKVEQATDQHTNYITDGRWY